MKNTKNTKENLRKIKEHQWKTKGKQGKPTETTGKNNERTGFWSPPMGEPFGPPDPPKAKWTPQKNNKYKSPNFEFSVGRPPKNYKSLNC